MLNSCFSQFLYTQGGRRKYFRREINIRYINANIIQKKTILNITHKIGQFLINAKKSVFVIEILETFYFQKWLNLLFEIKVYTFYILFKPVGNLVVNFVQNFTINSQHAKGKCHGIKNYLKFKTINVYKYCFIIIIVPEIIKLMMPTHFLPKI
jgi:hypothetical protein